MVGVTLEEFANEAQQASSDSLRQSTSNYVPYVATLNVAKSAREHPSPAVESSCLAAISLPTVAYKLHRSLLNSCSLSSLQVEAVVLTCAKHESFHLGARYGMLLGDGAGIGKGREISAIIRENYLRGRKKSLWMSSSSLLYSDARRDFCDIGVKGEYLLKNFTSIYKNSTGLPHEQYCLFVSYATFRKNFFLKLKAISDWMSGDFDGVIVLDECHSLKSSESWAAKAVHILDKQYPRARFLYASATIAEAADELEYMNRLFLWGPGTAYPEGFLQLKLVVEKLGVIGMETIAMELKQRGSFVARRLDFSSSLFNVKVVELSPGQIEMYNKCSQLWLKLKSELDSSIKSKEKRKVMMHFWREHQAFFKLLCVSFKLDFVVNYSKELVKDGMAVIIGLQSTGNSVIMPKNNTPTRRLPSALYLKFQNMLKHVELMVSSSFLKKLKVEAKGIGMPPNGLDYLVNRLGVKNVTELTGRRGRYEKMGRTYIYRRILNSRSKRVLDFMEGKNYICIISEASSTGISLHADRGTKNQRKRIQLTIDLPWSAEQVIQQCGRSLRSNQSVSPDFILIVSDCAGEKRFGYGISERMSALGAITQGDRTLSINGINFFSMNSKYAKQAIKYTLQTIICEIVPIVRYPGQNIFGFFKEAFTPLFHAGLLKIKNQKPVLAQMDTEVTKFFNRLLMLQLPLQNTIIAYMYDIYQTIITHRKQMGTYEEGVLDLGKGEETFVTRQEYFTIDYSTVSLVSLMVDNGISFLRMKEIFSTTTNCVIYINDRGPNREVYLAVPEPRSGHYSIVYPYGITSEKSISPRLNLEYKQVSLSVAKLCWEKMYNSKSCIHVYFGLSCKDTARFGYCDAGTRFQKKFILTGMLWSNLIQVSTCLNDSGVKVLQPTICQVGGRKIFGVGIDKSKVDLVRTELKKLSKTK